MKIEGVIDGEKVVKYIREKFYKYVEIVKVKEIKKKEEEIKEKKVELEIKSGVKVIDV